MIRSKIFLVSILFAIFLDINSQSISPNIKNYTIEDGLSQSSIYCIIQDDKGFLWFGTQNGLNRYDGYNFHNIPINRNNTTYENIINCITKDNQGKLWIGTYAGLFIYDVSKEQFDFEFIMDKSHFDDKKITGLHYFKENIYVRTQDALIAINANNGSTIELLKIPSRIRSISSVDKAPIINIGDSVLFAVDTSLFILNTKSNVLFIEPKYNGVKINCFYNLGNGIVLKGTDKSFEANGNPILKDTSLYFIQEFNEKIWMGTEKGIFTYDKYFNISSRKFIQELDSIKFLCAYLDCSGKLWIGSYRHGIYLIDSVKKKFTNSIHNQLDIMSIYKRNDTLFLGTRSHGLRISTNRKSIEISGINPIGVIVGVITEINNEIWITSSDEHYNFNEIYLLREKKFQNLKIIYPQIANKIDSILTSNRIFRIIEDDMDNIWLGTSNGLIKLITTKNTIVNIKTYTCPSVTAIIKTAKLDTLIIGTFNGMYKYLYLKDSLETYQSYQNYPNSNSIHCIIRDHNKNYWISTNKGLNKYSQGLELIGRYKSTDGLPDDFIYELVDDGHNIWLSSNNGLGKISYENEPYYISSYKKNDGIDNLEFNAGACFCDIDGEIYFGGIGSLYAFYPDKIINDSFKPPIYITKLITQKTAEEKVYYYPLNKAEIRLDVDINSFVVFYSALDYTDPMSNQYKYILEGYDKDWTITTGSTKPVAVYMNLPSGNYRLRIKGTNNDGIWNDFNEATLEIKIRSSFLRSNSFIILLVCFVILFFIIMNYQILKNIEKRKAEDIIKNEKILLKEERDEALRNLTIANAQVIDSKILAAKSAFIAIISHEINTPLEVGSLAVTKIRDATIDLKNKFERNILTESSFKLFIEPVLEMSIASFKNMQAASRLIKSLKEVSRDQMSGVSREIIIKDFLIELFNTLKPEWQNSELQFEIICEPENMKVHTFPGALSQIVMNLITNSIRHGFDDFKNRKGGKIEIAIKRYSKTLVLKYRDNGNGIKPDDLKRIFDPYFSTKRGTGSGLGLTIVKKLVEDERIFDGKIRCESKVGQGVEFTIFIKLLN